MPPPTLDDYRWLVSPAATPALVEALLGTTGSVAIASRLRKMLSPERARLVIEQAELRRKAALKFRRAAEMFFTARGLEQATDEIVAAYKSRRVAEGSRVLDICCGIGGDLMSLAQRGPTRGVDRDPIVATLAEANLRALRGALSVESPFPANILVENISPRLLADVDAWHIDPDRRIGGARTTRVELGEPSPAAIDVLLAAGPNAAIKLAPAAEPPTAWAARAELEWISRRGECRQLVAWFGALARTPGQRRATVLRTIAGGGVERSVVGSGEAETPVAERIGCYVFEPDAAVLAAGLTGELAALHSLECLVPRGAYLTGEHPAQDAALAAFAVDAALPFDARRVKALLRERRIGRLEVKQRGTDLDPATVRRQLRVPGDERATLLLARLENRVIAIVARRIEARGF